MTDAKMLSAQLQFASGKSVYSLDSVSDDCLRGFWPPAQGGDRGFRWAKPSAALRIDVPPRDYELTLSMRHLCCLWEGRVNVSINGKPVPYRGWTLRRGNVSLRLERDDFPKADRFWLELHFQPIETSNWKEPDPRLLGAPLFQVALKPLGKSRERLPSETQLGRYFPLGHPGMLAPIDVWLGQLWAARFHVGWRYFPRLLATLAPALCNTLLSLPERVSFHMVRNKRFRDDPLFVVGMHRSGTTHLHNLLALDPQFVTTRNWQAVNPAGSIFSGRLIAMALAAVMPHKRPMDAVRMGAFSPQEDEFAVASSSMRSPYWAFSFPQAAERYERYYFVDELSDGERTSWQRTYRDVVHRLTFWSRRRFLSKNPCNTARIAALRELFPNAKFVRITRHPYDVYRSYLHFVREGMAYCHLQEPKSDAEVAAAFLRRFRKSEDAFRKQAAALPPGCLAEMRFEDLENELVGQLKLAYQKLGLRWSDAFEERLEGQLAKDSKYTKNRHAPLTHEERMAIDQQLGPYMKSWGYESFRSDSGSPALQAA